MPGCVITMMLNIRGGNTADAGLSVPAVSVFTGPTASWGHRTIFTVHLRASPSICGLHGSFAGT